MPDKRKIAEAVTQGAIVLMLLGWVYELAQRVAVLEGRANFFHGEPSPVEQAQPPQ